MISENSRIVDSKCTHNVEILRGKDELKGALNPVCEEKDVAVAHKNNINQRYDNLKATVSDIESVHIKLQSRIDDITSDLVVSRESAYKIKTNWTTISIVNFHLEKI